MNSLSAMRKELLHLIAWMLACIVPLSATAANVDIEKIDGVVGGNKIPIGTEISIYIRITNDFSDTILQVANAFRVYSPDSADWFPHAFIDSSLAITGQWVIDTTFYAEWTDSSTGYGLNWQEYFLDRGSAAYWKPTLGYPEDTAGYWAVDVTSHGIFPGETIVPWIIRIDSVSATSTGALLCIDSCSHVDLPWIWFNGGVHDPTWGGPYCFEIVADCCESFRGNINLDWLDQIDIGDLTALVGWMFKSGSAPPCLLEADVDGNDNYDIQDVTYLVGYMFKSGPEPAGCP